MSTEQEISGAERDTMRRELNYRVRSGRPIGFEQGWRACLEYDRDGATAERQRADMAEEREKALQEKIARAAAALVYLAPALDALGVALLHGDPLAELRVRFSDLIPEIEKAVSILGDTDVS